MTGINRLPAPAGLLIDRSRTRTFKFEGQPVDGCAGDTIASALAANDICRVLSNTAARAGR